MMTAAMIAIVVLGGSAGDVFITKGMKQIGEISTMRPGELVRVALRVLSNPNFLIGVFFMACSFFAFLAVLSWADLSFVLPATSLSFVITTIGAKFVLKEEITRLRLAGTALVCLGVALISLP
jgi:drug/metabolite transporter (DMT)-like permease